MPHNGLRMAFSVPLDLGPAHFRATKINFRKTATDENLGTTAMRQRGRHHLERNSQAKRALSPHRGHCPRRHPPPLSHRARPRARPYGRSVPFFPTRAPPPPPPSPCLPAPPPPRPYPSAYFSAHIQPSGSHSHSCSCPLAYLTSRLPLLLNWPSGRPFTRAGHQARTRRMVRGRHQFRPLLSSVGVKSAHGQQSEDGFKVVHGGWSVGGGEPVHRAWTVDAGVPVHRLWSECDGDALRAVNGCLGGRSRRVVGGRRGRAGARRAVDGRLSGDAGRAVGRWRRRWAHRVCSTPERGSWSAPLAVLLRRTLGA